MNKIILKNALITIGTLAVVALLVFSLWILISPQSMAAACEKTGNYSFAVTCADLRYKYTNDLTDLSRCAEDSILSGKNDLIVKYGEKLIVGEGYDKLCAEKDKSLSQSSYGEYTVNYKAYIGGNLAAAQYRTGNFDKAVETAQGAQSFTKLVIEIIESGTKEEAERVVTAIDGSDAKLTKLLQEFINERN